MQPLNLPTYPVKMRRAGDRIQIFDFLRRRYIALTPEEWVRQHFTHFLVERKGYPAGLLANEVGLKVGSVVRRCDSVLYHREGGVPQMIVEYKAPHITITQETFNQVVAYNSVLRADYLVVSNGLQHYCCRMDYKGKHATYLREIPDWKDL